MHLAHWWWVSIFFCVFDSDFKIFFVFLILPSLWWVRGVGWWWVFWYFGHCHCSGFIVCFLWWRHCDVVSAVFRGGYGGRKGLQEEEEYGFVLVFTQHRFYFKKKNNRTHVIPLNQWVHVAAHVTCQRVQLTTT